MWTNKDSHGTGSETKNVKRDAEDTDLSRDIVFTGNGTSSRGEDRRAESSGKCNEA